MKRIFFLTPAPYNGKIENKSLYQSFDLMAKGDFDPHVSPEAIDYLNNKSDFNKLRTISKIYVSRANRTYETAVLIRKILNKDLKIIKTKYLNEIEFTMDNLLTEREFYKKDVDFARMKFIEKFIGDKTIESFNSVISRISKCLKILNKEEQDILCISHSFFMKIFEIYLLEKNIKSNRSLVLKRFSGKTKLYKSCEGFEFDVE